MKRFLTSFGMTGLIRVKKRGGGKAATPISQLAKSVMPSPDVLVGNEASHST